MPYVVTESIKRKPELAVGDEAHFHAHNATLQNQASRRKMRRTYEKHKTNHLVHLHTIHSLSTACAQTQESPAVKAQVTHPLI